MNSEPRNRTKFFSSGNIAFVVVVCASYASATAALIRSRRVIPLWEIFVLVAIAAAYLIVGTYGFAICRRSRSLTTAVVYFIAQLSLASALILSRGSSGQLSVILLPLAGQSALLLPLAWMIPVCVLIYLTLLMPWILRSSGWVDAIELAVVCGTGIVFVIVFTRGAASEREARNELAAANRRLRQHAAQVEELATTKERNRLAREIHDSLGHYLTVVNVQISAAQTILAQDRSRALDHLAKAKTLTQEGLAEIRRSVATLRASPTESRPLPDALAKLVEQWNSAGMQATLTVVGNLRTLSPHADLTIYRAAQEALTNVGKHAKTSHVDLILDFGSDSSVRLRVRDDGEGSSNAHGGFGLLGVRERVHLLHGEVRVRTEVGLGFTLEVELPE